MATKLPIATRQKAYAEIGFAYLNRSQHQSYLQNRDSVYRPGHPEYPFI